MIISHRYKYLFVELPHTGTTAISAELRELYDGTKILHKHAHYSEFLRTASPAERGYFTFSCIRNPLDVAVSLYFRHKTDHHGRYSKPRGTVTRSDVELFRFIERTGADFPTYFRRVYARPLPYDNFSREAHAQFDFVMRFENLQDDFAKFLELVGIEPQRRLPMVNRTSERRADFASYYTPDIIPRAKWVFGPFMERWKYELPPGWGSLRAPLTARLIFRSVGAFRRRFETRLRGSLLARRGRSW